MVAGYDRTPQRFRHPMHIDKKENRAWPLPRALFCIVDCRTLEEEHFWDYKIDDCSETHQKKERHIQNMPPSVYIGAVVSGSTTVFFPGPCTT